MMRNGDHVMDMNKAVEILKDYSGCDMLLEGLERVDSEIEEGYPIPSEVRAAFNIVFYSMRSFFVEK